MTTRLTDNERTLLSAHCDGELSGADREIVERLLAGSEEARDYVRDLRSLTEFSQSAFPATPATGAVIGSRITSSAIETAARTASKTATGVTWGVVGLAAAAVTTVAVLTSTLGRDEATVTEPRAHSASAPTMSTAPMTARSVGLDLDAAALTVPAITSRELIDFAVSGRLPVDSARNCYVSVVPKQGSLAIDLHAEAGDVPAQLSSLDLRAVPGIDSIERAIRTSLLQSDGRGLAISYELPALRLRMLEELQIVADELPEEIRRTMDDARAELGREYRRLSTELRRSHPGTEHRAESATRYVVVAASDLPRPGDVRTAGGSYTILAGDRRARTVELSSAELGMLASFVKGPRFAALERPEPVRARAAGPARAAVPTRATVFVRRPAPATPAAGVPATEVGAVSKDSTISFEQLQILRQRGETLDGIYIRTESFIDRANRILIQADSIRRRIEIIRSQQIDGRDNGDDLEETLEIIDEGAGSEGEMDPE